MPSRETGRMEEFREQAQPGIQFDERDRRSLTPTERDPKR